MSDNKKLPLMEVAPAAFQLVEKLRPFCTRIEVAGSIRRQRPTVGDIEIVALPVRPLDLFGNPVVGPTRLGQFLREKLGLGLVKDGPKYKQFLYGRHKVDLFLPETPDHWGCIYTIRTGSHEFNQWLIEFGKRRGLNFSGGLLWRATGEAVETPQEADVFSAMSLPVISPLQRDDYRWTYV